MTVIWIAGAGVSYAQNETPDPYELIGAAIDNFRSTTSYAELRMLIHRPDWQRTSSMVAWTRGRSDSLVRFTAPARDAGNALLQNDRNMWTYTPKLNRVIRLPYSMMSQAWAGSDLSYNDLSRSDNVLHHYQLTVVDVGENDGRVTYTIEAVPFDSAPVVWGREDWVVREDGVVVSQTFYDQDLEPLKRLDTLEIRDIDGRPVATRMRMSKLDEPGRYTEMEFTKMEFDLPLQDRLFTTFTLQSGAVPESGRGSDG